jgi:putative PIN family toxin of toxin-antitoxin system
VLRAVLDPGVLVAAAITPRGVCGWVLQAVLDERCSVVACPALLAELEEVLLRPKFRRYLTMEQARRYVALIAGVSERRPDPAARPGLTPDPDDDYLVALAQAAGVDYLVSGDPHLTGLAEPQPPVLAPRAFLERLGSADLPREADANR